MDFQVSWCGWSPDLSTECVLFAHLGALSQGRQTDGAQERKKWMSPTHPTVHTMCDLDDVPSLCAFHSLEIRDKHGSLSAWVRIDDLTCSKAGALSMTIPASL